MVKVGMVRFFFMYVTWGFLAKSLHGEWGKFEHLGKCSFFEHHTAQKLINSTELPKHLKSMLLIVMWLQYRPLLIMRAVSLIQQHWMPHQAIRSWFEYLKPVFTNWDYSRGYHQTCLLVESQLGHLQTSDHPETPCVTEIDPPDGVPHFSLSLLSHLFEK